MARRGKKLTFIPMVGDLAQHEELGRVRIVEHSRPNGIYGATVRPVDPPYSEVPGGGMRWVALRDLTPPEGSNGGVVGHRVAHETGVAAGAGTGQRPIRFTVVSVVNTRLAAQRQYDFGVHAFGCPDVKSDRRLHRCEIYHHYETNPKAVVKAEREALAKGGYGEEADELVFKVYPCCKPAQTQQGTRRRRVSTKSPDLQADKSSLQTERRSGSVTASSKRATPNNQRRTKVARRTAAVKDKETATTSRRSRGKAKAAPEPEENGGSTRMTHADKLKLVPQIVKELKSGRTFAEIRQDPDYPSSGLRKALAEKGYDTKGNKIEADDDLSELEGKALAKAVANMRENGAPWYRCELAADMPQAELKELLVDHGYEEFVGRVSRAQDEEEVEEKPKRSRSGSKTSGSSRKRGSAKTAEAEAPASKPARRRGRRRANPSDED